MTQQLSEVLQRPHKKLVTYVMAGDPDAEGTLEAMRDLVAGGADIIELGIPFSDPAADGKVIQAAGLRAIKGGMTLCRTLDLVADFRLHDNSTPIILMGYANPIFSYGFKAFADDAARVGVDGVIAVDLPPEESSDLIDMLAPHGVSFIRLVTPTTSPERMQVIAQKASGFLYYVSMTGVTGTGHTDADAIRAHLDQLRPACTLPIMIGFGIKTPRDAKLMASLADGVVVGSAIVERLHEGKNVTDFIKDLKKAVCDA